MKCALCGHERTPECGYATINGRFICHPDDDRTSDCYYLHTVYGHRLLTEKELNENKSY